MVSPSRVSQLRRDVESAHKKVARARGSLEDARKALLKEERLLSDAKTDSSKKSRARGVESARSRVRSKEGDVTKAENDLGKSQIKLTEVEGQRAKEQDREHQQALKRLSDAEKRFESTRASLSSEAVAPVSVQAQREWDVFLSHASEDKEGIATPLARSLEAQGLSVWFDAATLKVGDSLRKKIDEGLASSRFGIVILSPLFFAKQWTQAELDGLVARQHSSDANVILPVWHKITRDELLSYSPTLSGLVALNTAIATVDEIAEKIAEVVRG